MTAAEVNFLCAAGIWGQGRERSEKGALLWSEEEMPKVNASGKLEADTQGQDSSLSDTSHVTVLDSTSLFPNQSDGY